MNLFIVILAAMAVTAHCQCPQDYEYVGGRCLLFLPDVSLTALEARETCQTFGGDLVKLDDCQLLRDIDSYLSVNGMTDKNFWIGADDVITEGTFQWIDGSPVAMGAPFWSSFRPEPGYTLEPQSDDGEDCAAMASGDGFYFHNFNCGNSDGYAPLCQRAPVLNSCVSPYVLIGDSCYQFLPTLSETWEEARTVCQSSGGDLIVIEDCYMFSTIIHYIQDSGLVPPGAYWIGGHRIDSVWQWINGTSMPMGVAFWGTSGTGSLEPNNSGDGEDCVEIRPAFRSYFNDANCMDSKASLCEAPLE